MHGIQIFSSLFGLFMIYLTFLHLKRKEFKIAEFGLWAIFWLVLMFLALFPNSLDFLVKDLLKLTRPLDFFIIVGFLFLIFMSFSNYTDIKKNNQRIEKIIRRISFKKVEEKNPENNQPTPNQENLPKHPENKELGIPPKIENLSQNQE